jgi:hypothetical protein
MALVLEYIYKAAEMKKMWGIAKNMIRAVCVCVIFPGVDIDIDNLSGYFEKGEASN